MKPFDLEAARAGKKVQTKEGNKVSHLYFNYKDQSGVDTIFGLETLPNGTERPCSWRDDGRYESHYSGRDLVMAPEIREYWVNLHRNEYDCINPITVSRVWDTQEQALNRANVRDHSYIKTIKIHEEEI